MEEKELLPSIMTLKCPTTIKRTLYFPVHQSLDGLWIDSQGYNEPLKNSAAIGWVTATLEWSEADAT